jgi:hypothetical protein
MDFAKIQEITKELVNNQNPGVLSNFDPLKKSFLDFA